MVKEGIIGQDNIYVYYQKICEIVDGDVSVEVIFIDFEGIIKEGEVFFKLAFNIVVKVLMIKDGVKVLSYFCDNGICINCMLVFFVGQVILVVKVGVIYFFFFIGCIDDISWDGIVFIE